MIDKFIDLTRKILKVLSVDYSMVYVKDSSLGAGRIMRIIYDSPNLIFSTILEMSVTSRPYNGTTLIVIFARVVNTVDVYNSVPVDSQHEDINLAKPYMDIIYSIFNHDAQHANTVGHNLYSDIAVNDTNNKILDELLSYTDDELKLYVSLL